jgi:hypothetical protein
MKSGPRVADLVSAFDAIAAIGGLGGVLAVVVFFYARRDALSHKREWRIVAERYEGQSSALIQIVQDSTKAITANTETARSLVTATQELRQEVTALRKSNER